MSEPVSLLRGGQHLQQFLIGFDALAGFAKFVFHVADRTTQRAIAAVQIVQQSQFAQIGAHAAFDLRQSPGRGIQIGLRQIGGFRQFGNQALSFLIAQILRADLQLFADGGGQRHGPALLSASTFK